jgi:hypothetical protein
MAMRKEAFEAKWIQMSEKPNKDFLAKPQASRKRIGNMTIDNVKDQPGLPRTDDINTILHNFVEYYSKLNEHKKICPIALDRLKNLTLTLDPNGIISKRGLPGKLRDQTGLPPLPTNLRSGS